MNHGVVDTESAAFFKGLFFVTADAVFKACAESEVAACVFVKECFVECDSSVLDGRILRNESAFAEVSRVFVHCNHLAEEFLVLFSLNVDSLAVLECDGEVFDKLAAV